MKTIDPLRIVFDIRTNEGVARGEAWRPARVALHQVPAEHREAFTNGLAVPYGAYWIKLER